MLLDSARSHLIVIDAQERLVPAIADAGPAIDRCGILLKSADRLGVPVTATEQYPKGLGRTVKPMADLMPASAATLEKIAFAASADLQVAARTAELRAEGRSQLVLAGFEAHVCVLQTALGFREEGYDVFVVADAVSSRSPHSVSAACARLLHAGCHWVTTEMVVFEWLGQAGTDNFRALSALIK
jgi:nicotinamidase-related amidase